MTTSTSESAPLPRPSLGSRMWAYLTEHVFEGVALVFSVTAALSYAVGRSHLDGWAEMAGVPGMMFRPDLYDTILAGVQLQSVWRTAAFVVVLSTLYLWANVVVPEWWAGRLPNVKRRRRWQDGCDQLALRRRFAYAARAASKGVPPEQRSAVVERMRWKVIGRRGLRRMARRTSSRGTAKRLRPITLTLILTVSVTLFATGIYLLLQFVLLSPAKADGARAFVKTYAAVTGHIPYQYIPAKVASTTLQTWACEGRSMLSQYRSVALADPDAAGSPKEPFYLLQGFGSTFVLLGEKGSVIRSFGDAPFSLPESPSRPLSDLAKACK
ncbi:hypothetical protein FEP90_04436 [Burkholderia multivorans]|nr:hypothetical protein [Burkholderia multivorans]MDR8768110.1 hypothetical protein [Burkholderia multivorans]MDR8791109.1 hypothetical protein [Burkholderia multivorans]MDR8797025.1 hypothetical protein [Burkholderia multivorans]MDR8802605.1 hypothetical protein [Burkholderia multivorans]